MFFFFFLIYNGVKQYTLSINYTSVQYSVDYMGYSTHLNKIGFLLSDFAQLYSKVSVLSMLKIG